MKDKLHTSLLRLTSCLSNCLRLLAGVVSTTLGRIIPRVILRYPYSLLSPSQRALDTSVESYRQHLTSIIPLSSYLIGRACPNPCQPVFSAGPSSLQKPQPSNAILGAAVPELQPDEGLACQHNTPKPNSSSTRPELPCKNSQKFVLVTRAYSVWREPTDAAPEAALLSPIKQ